MKKQIDSIVLHNYKKHGDYKGTVNGNHFLLIGKNGVGKTSILDVIKRALGMKIKPPKKPVTEGAQKGVSNVHLAKNGDKYVMEERYTLAGDGRLRFYKVEGDRRDELVPAMKRFAEVFGAPPLDFSELMAQAGKDQYVWLRDNLALDISAQETEYDKLYKQRRGINRELETANQRLKLPEVRVSPEERETFTEEKSIADLVAKKKVAVEAAALKRDEILNVVKTIEFFDRIEASAKETQEQITALQEKLSKAVQWMKENPRQQARRDELKKEFDALEGDSAAIDTEMMQAGEHNKGVQKVKAYFAAEQDAADKQKQSDVLSTELNKVRESIKKALAGFQLGDVVPGLELRYQKDDEGDVIEQGLFLDGLPFNRNQLAYGDLLKAVVKLAAHFNADKAINFVAIGDWNLLDEDNQAEILQFVRENQDSGIQLAIEKVDNNKQIITEIIEK